MLTIAQEEIYIEVSELKEAIERIEDVVKTSVGGINTLGAYKLLCIAVFDLNERLKKLEENK